MVNNIYFTNIKSNMVMSDTLNYFAIQLKQSNYFNIKTIQSQCPPGGESYIGKKKKQLNKYTTLSYVEKGNKKYQHFLSIDIKYKCSYHIKQKFSNRNDISCLELYTIYTMPSKRNRENTPKNTDGQI